MINQRYTRFFNLILGAIIITGCNMSPAGEATQTVEPPTTAVSTQTATATQMPPTPEPASPTDTPQPEVNVYNIYVGKDENRQPAVLGEPLVNIIQINEAAEFSGSYAEIFLDGKSVTGSPIKGGEEMLRHLILLLDEAREAGFHSQTVYSTYRSYEDQAFLTNRGAVDFLEDTGQFLAAPGRSEHQLGTAVDLGWGAFLLTPYITYNNEAAGNFYQWLKANVYSFGFVISYPFKSNEDASQSNLFVPWITEYKAETWHIRFVGIALATQIQNYLDEQGRNYLDPYSAIIPQQFYLP